MNRRAGMGELPIPEREMRQFPSPETHPNILDDLYFGNC
jgi:hypothetical protein